MANLKYIEEDYLQDFLVGMAKYDTQTLLADLSVRDLLEGKVPEENNTSVTPYQAAEAFLVMFETREEYEICSKLLNKWPDLKRV